MAVIVKALLNVTVIVLPAPGLRVPEALVVKFTVQVVLLVLWTWELPLKLTPVGVPPVIRTAAPEAAAVVSPAVATVKPLPG